MFVKIVTDPVRMVALYATGRTAQQGGCYNIFLLNIWSLTLLYQRRNRKINASNVVISFQNLVFDFTVRAKNFSPVLYDWSLTLLYELNEENITWLISCDLLSKCGL